MDRGKIEVGEVVRVKSSPGATGGLSTSAMPTLDRNVGRASSRFSRGWRSTLFSLAASCQYHPSLRYFCADFFGGVSEVLGCRSPFLQAPLGTALGRYTDLDEGLSLVGGLGNLLAAGRSRCGHSNTHDRLKQSDEESRPRSMPVGKHW